MFKKCLYIITLLAFASCASLHHGDIQIPKDVASKNKVKEIPKEKQKSLNEISLVVPMLPSAAATRSKKKKATVEVKKVINPFVLGEVIKLDLYYIGIKAATLTTTVMPDVEIEGKKAFHFNGVAETSALMKLIYKVYNVIDIYIDQETFTPIKMILTMDESKQNVSMVLNYDQKTGKSHFWKKRIDKDGNVTEINRIDELTPMAQDIFSSLYYVRAQSFKAGDKFNFVVHDNGKNWNVTMNVLKQEKVWTRLGDVDTLLLHPTAEHDGEKFTKGDMSLWVTNDDKKIPVKFEAQVRIGSMKGIIKDYIK